MITKQEIITASKIHPSRILNIYLFGSRVYGVASKTSDYDVVIIAKTHLSNVELVSNNNINIHILTSDIFQDSLDQHHIRSLECIMAPDWAILQENHKFTFDLNIARLRHSISHINSNSWVKSKKKLLQGDYYSSIKSIWHSMRIVLFGTQIAKFGKIVDFSEANYLWNEIISKKWTWEELDERFRKLNNELLSSFRLVARKG